LKPCMTGILRAEPRRRPRTRPTAGRGQPALAPGFTPWQPRVSPSPRDRPLPRRRGIPRPFPIRRVHIELPQSGRPRRPNSPLAHPRCICREAVQAVTNPRVASYRAPTDTGWTACKDRVTRNPKVTRRPGPAIALRRLQSLPFQQLQVLLTLYSESFASFPRGTCALSVSHRVFSLGWSIPPGFRLHSQAARLCDRVLLCAQQDYAAPPI